MRYLTSLFKIKKRKRSTPHKQKPYGKKLASFSDYIILLEAEKSGLSKENTEIAFFGGSFTAIDRNYMLSLLDEAKPFIEKGAFSGIRISTRPDAIDKEVLILLKRLESL